MGGVVVDHLLFRLSISQYLTEIFANKVWSCLKSHAQLVFGMSTWAPIAYFVGGPKITEIFSPIVGGVVVEQYSPLNFTICSVCATKSWSISSTYPQWLKCSLPKKIWFIVVRSSIINCSNDQLLLDKHAYDNSPWYPSSFATCSCPVSTSAWQNAGNRPSSRFRKISKSFMVFWSPLKLCNMHIKIFSLTGKIYLN